MLARKYNPHIHQISHDILCPTKIAKCDTNSIFD